MARKMYPAARLKDAWLLCSVEHDHPRALEFLREDCTHVTDFFKRKVSVHLRQASAWHGVRRCRPRLTFMTANILVL